MAADFVNRRMNRSRSRRVVLLLDCCYAGAFERGMTARAGAEIGVESQFGGRGRAVITASSSMEYAFEGDELADTYELAPSVFTSALVQGLETGDADRDQDGLVALDEMYDYIYDKVREATPNQTPGKWTFGVQGELVSISCAASAGARPLTQVTGISALAVPRARRPGRPVFLPAEVTARCYGHCMAYPLTAAQAHLGELVAEARQNHRPVTISEHGHPVAALIGIDDLADLEDRAALAAHLADKAAGRGGISLDDLDDALDRIEAETLP